MCTVRTEMKTGLALIRWIAVPFAGIGLPPLSGWLDKSSGWPALSKIGPPTTLKFQAGEPLFWGFPEPLPTRIFNQGNGQTAKHPNVELVATIAYMLV